MISKLVVTMDAGRFKAYRLEESPEFSNPRLCCLEDWTTGVNEPLSEQVTDQRGQFTKNSRSFAAISDMADGERHSLELERRRRAIKRMASRIGDLLDEEELEACYLLAPQELLAALNKELVPPVRERIQKQIPANVTRLNPEAVINQLT